jgi:hypothetical protein
VIPIVLGPKSEPTKFQARERLEQEITKQSGVDSASRVMNDGSVTFGWFVRNRFFPLKEANWKPETAKVKRLIIQKDLIDAFDGIPLENFDRFALQLHLNQLAKTKSKDRVLQIKAYVRDILAEAVEQDFLTKDPARKVTVPSQLRDTDRTHFDLGAAARCALAALAAGSYFAGTRHDKCLASQRTVCSAMEVLQLRRIENAGVRNSVQRHH